jgi:FkbM family methyltransferase
MKNTELYDCGLWDKNETLEFLLSSRLSETSGFSYFKLEYLPALNDNAHFTMDAVSMDSKLKNERVTFIKLDTEGAELNALKGAETIIKEQRPRMALSVYHKAEDILEIPKFLLNLNPFYKFALRHYSFFNNETVLYVF